MPCDKITGIMKKPSDPREEICLYSDLKGYPPTIRERAAKFKISSSSRPGRINIRRRPLEENGDIALLKYESPVKRLKFADNHIRLNPENPDMKPITSQPHDNRWIRG